MLLCQGWYFIITLDNELLLYNNAVICQGWYFIITLDNELLYNNAVMSGLVFYNNSGQ